MKLEPSEFPVFRKYLNSNSYFKIISPIEFEEVKKNPDGYSVHAFTAKILPDRNLIYDMLYNFEKHWKEIDAQEYLAVRSLANNQ